MSDDRSEDRRVLEATLRHAQTQGLAGAPAVRILASEARHGSIERAVGLLGLGRQNIVALATDTLGRIEPAELERALAIAATAAVLRRAMT
jgi:glutamate/tyrosine decarboxylase-like PLP-dependent enzyme